jgi:hypothetical protein
MAREMAGNVSSYLMFGTILLTPIFGWIADNKGKSATLMYLGSALLIVAHLTFAKTYIEPRIPIFILGIAFSLVPAAMWPAVTKIVGENKLGTAYGFMFSVQNVGLFLFPMLIGSVLDSSNPGYVQQINADKFAQMQEAGFGYSGEVYNSKGETKSNANMNITVVAHKDSMKGDIVWKEQHAVTTGKNGEFDIEVGEGDVLLAADFSQLVDTADYSAKLSAYDNGDTTMVYHGPLKNAEDQTFNAKLTDHVDKYAGSRPDGILEIYAENGELIWKEDASYHVGDNGEFEILLGKGKLISAEKDYFGFRSNEYYIEVIKPLDYTNPMLMLSGLGVLGLLFAFLLKREDKTSGYGLELPNKE